MTQSFRYKNLEAPVVQWVKHWPTDLAIPGSSIPTV